VRPVRTTEENIAVAIRAAAWTQAVIIGSEILHHVAANHLDSLLVGGAAAGVSVYPV